MIKKNIAALVESVEDVLAALGWEMPSTDRGAVQRTLFPNFSNPEEQVLFELLVREGELTSSVLSVKSGIPVSKVNAIMLALEFEGWVKTLPGNGFKVIK